MKQTKYTGTQTEKNLLAAFAGESQARNKYTYFASKAKKERRQRKASVITLVIVAVFLLGGMGYYIHSLKEKEASYLNRESELASEIAQEESIAENLENESRLRQTLKYIEQIAREKLGLVFPDEVIVKPSE